MVLVERLILIKSKNKKIITKFMEIVKYNNFIFEGIFSKKYKYDTLAKETFKKMLNNIDDLSVKLLSDFRREVVFTENSNKNQYRESEKDEYGDEEYQDRKSRKDKYGDEEYQDRTSTNQKLLTSGETKLIESPKMDLVKTTISKESPSEVDINKSKDIILKIIGDIETMSNKNVTSNNDNELKEIYKKMSQIVHPDKIKTSPLSSLGEEILNELFDILNKLYKSKNLAGMRRFQEAIGLMIEVLGKSNKKLLSNNSLQSGVLRLSEMMKYKGPRKSKRTVIISGDGESEGESENKKIKVSVNKTNSGHRTSTKMLGFRKESTYSVSINGKTLVSRERGKDGDPLVNPKLSELYYKFLDEIGVAQEDLSISNISKSEYKKIINDIKSKYSKKISSF
jgi:hypothetical protein